MQAMGRGGVRDSYLPKDLRFPRDHRVEPGSYPEQVPCRGLIHKETGVAVLMRFLHDLVYLDAVTRGEHDPPVPRGSRGQQPFARIQGGVALVGDSCDEEDRARQCALNVAMSARASNHIGRFSELRTEVPSLAVSVCQAV